MVKAKEKKLNDCVKKAREKGFYEGNGQKKVRWSEYTLNKVNDIFNAINFINTEVDKIKLPTQKAVIGRPPINPKKLAKALLFLEMMNLDEREGEGWLKIFKHHFHIHENLDDRVVGKAYSNIIVQRILHEVYRNNQQGNGIYCGDGSGLEKSRKENYESTKKKGLYVTTIVDSRQVVQEFSLESKQECQLMHDLVSNLKKRIIQNPEIQQKLTLDAGFIDRKLTELISVSGMRPFIFPKKGLTFKAKGSFAWKRMLNDFIKNVQAWLKEYHIRANVESFFSSIKRVFGIMTKRTPVAINTQYLCRVIHNNRRKLRYHEMISEG